MKKTMMILMLAMLCACSSKPEEETVRPTVPDEPVQVDPEPAADIKTIDLDKDFVEWRFDLQDKDVIYRIKEGLELHLSGQEKDVEYSDERAIVYDVIELNGSTLSIFDDLQVPINNKYGSLVLYDLNGQLFLLVTFSGAQFNGSRGIVFNRKGETVFTFRDADLNMNEYYQEQFMLSYTNPENMTDFRMEVYEADGDQIVQKELE